MWGSRGSGVFYVLYMLLRAGFGYEEFCTGGVWGLCVWVGLKWWCCVVVCGFTWAFRSLGRWVGVYGGVGSVGAGARTRRLQRYCTSRGVCWARSLAPHTIHPFKNKPTWSSLGMSAPRTHMATRRAPSIAPVRLRLRHTRLCPSWLKPLDTAS